MALKFDPALFSQATANLPNTPPPQVAEQQATAPLPDIGYKPGEITFVSPDQALAEQIERQDKADKDLEINREAFIESANQRYGIDPNSGVNKLNYKQLKERMQQDGLTSRQEQVVQQQWIASAERYRDSLPGGIAKDNLTAQIEQIKSIPMTIKDDNFINKVSESWRNASPRVEAQVERLANAVTNRLTMTDTDILKKYDPELLKRVEAMGGIDSVRDAGIGSKINEQPEDGWGVGGAMTFGTSKEKQDLGRELLEKLDNYRAKETLSREDQAGEVVVMPDGKEVPMSNRQAAQYYANQESSVAGRREWQRRFENSPFTAVKSLSDAGNFVATSLDSTISQAPTLVAGTAAMFVNPLAGLAIANSGNITDQELQAVNKAIEDEYKRIHGKDADVTKLSADEYAKFSMDVADKGLVSKASADGVVTGGLMTLAETAVGGFVDKLGGAALAKMPAKELEKNLRNKLSRIAFSGTGYGLKISDEGLQEVSSTIIENARTGKKWDDGLSQAFLLGAFSVENVAQHGGRAVGKANKIRKERNAGDGQDTDTTAGSTSGQTPPTEQASEPTEQAPTPTEQVPEPTEQAPTPSSEVSSNTTEPNSVNMSAEERDKLLREYEELIAQADDNGVLPEGVAKRVDEIEKSFVDDDGNSTFMGELNAWNNNGKQEAESTPPHAQTEDDLSGLTREQLQVRLNNVPDTPENHEQERAERNRIRAEINRRDLENANRENNRTSTSNADGQADQQGPNGTNTSGTQRGSETSEPVSPTETEATTEGHSQSDTKPTPNPTGQSDDNSQTSDATRIDGRTRETDATRGEQGELGRNGSEQSGESTQATGETSTDSGVRERAQSDSVGETLTPEQRRERITELEQQERKYHSSELGSDVDGNKNTSPMKDAKDNDALTGDGVGFNSKKALDKVYPAVKKDKPTVSNKERLQYPRNMTDEDIIAHKARMAALREEMKARGKTNSFLNARKDTFGTKSEMVEAMQAAMNEHPNDVTTNNALFKHATDLANQRKGRKGWSKNEATIQPPAGAKLSDTRSDSVHNTTTREKDYARGGRNVVQVPAFDGKNRINNAIDRAVAQQEEQNNPYLKEFKISDLRQNQKRASELLKENPKHADQIKEAFFARTPTARPASWGAVERGYLKFSTKNPNHKEFKGSRDGLLGFDFDGNAVYGSPQMVFDEIKKSDNTEDIATLTLAEQPQDTRETTNKAVDNVLRTAREHEQAAREAVEEFAKENNVLEEDGSKVLGTNENIAWASNRSDFMDWVKGKSEVLHKLFKKVQNVLASVLAVVAVGSMTIPQDAKAHTGYSVYESGPKIENVSQQASDTIHWVMQNKDHNGKAFVVADKAQGKIYIVGTDGKVLNTQNAIFGKGKGDSATLGNTPSGRFLLQKTSSKGFSKADQRLYGDSVLDFTDKETGRAIKTETNQIVAMHRVINTAERKAALNTATPNDNYLSHGCINIPTAFYDSAVDKLDGAMVYVLKQDGKSTVSRDTAKSSAKDNSTTKSSNTTRSTSQSNARGSSLEIPKSSKLSFSVKAKDVANITEKVSVEKLRKALDKTLGDLADKVNFITEADYGKVKGFDKIRNAGVEGFYDPINQRVYIVADNVQAQNGLTAEERMAWVAWHELVHNGLDVKYGEDLRATLFKAQGNAFITDLARAIMQDRRENQLAEVGFDKATEEALAELGAALKTGNVKALATRYGVEIPLEYQGGLKGIIGKHLIGLRNVISRLLGKKMFTTKQVERLLEDALKEVRPDKATREFAQKAIEDVNDPNSALSQAVMFSVADAAKNFVKDISHIITGGDISRTGSTPARDGTKAAKERTTRQGLLSRFWTGVQDAQQIIIDLDPEGNGGRLSNAVATFSNKSAQMSRKFRSKIKNLEMEFNKFAAENKDLFPTRRDRRQIDHVVQDVTSSLRAITGGNASIRKRVETTIFGEDVYDDDGNFVKHVPGLADRVNEYAEYVSNAQQQGLQPSSYVTAKLKEYTQLLEDQLAIQDKFDQADSTIIQRTKDGPDVSRKDWRGHDGFTTAEAEQKLRDLKEKGFIDIDVDNLTKVPYQVKRYIRGKNGNPDTFAVETHYRYDTDDVKKVAKGRIMSLVNKYVDLSQNMYQTAVELVGKDIIGDAPSEAWQVGTMGKVRNAYTTKAKDANGTEIDNVYDVSQSSNIDNIISLRQAAEYQSRLNGRAFNGGTALENLTWHIDLMSKQAASQHIGKVLLDMSNDPTQADKVKVYRRNDKYYSTQNGILVTRDKVVNGRPVLDKYGEPEREVVKVSFADEAANKALFGDNIAREEITNGNLVARALFGMISNLTRLGSLGLTGSIGFSISNAMKGYNEKVNQILAWTKDSPFVKSMPQDIQDKYFAKGKLKGAAQGTALQALIGLDKYSKGLNPSRQYSMQRAAIRFTQEIIDNKKIADAIRNIPGWGKETEAEYQKLLVMYKAGGISSKVEELIASNKELKARFAAGPVAAKLSNGISKALDTAASITMSQELVSSLMTYDLLTENLGMPADKAIEANLHFMNFNKRGNWKIMDYIRKYTMFGNAIAQGSKAFQNAWIEQTNDVNDSVLGMAGYKLSDRAVGRAIRNIGLGMGMNLFARMLADNVCADGDKGLGSPFDRLNPYELVRDVPIAYSCGEDGPEYFRFPVEYGTGNVENAVGVGLVQYAKGAWSLDQAKDFVFDSLRDNALPFSVPILKTSDPFQLAVSFLLPLVPEPLKGSVLAFGGIDDFGNPLNSMSYPFKTYKPATAKKTTDQAWTDLAESLYGMGIFGNLSPEQAKVLATSWTQGVLRDLLVSSIEDDPKKSVWKSLTGYNSLVRDAKGYDKAAYTMAQTYLQNRYGDLNEIAIKAEGTNKGKITDKWLEENGYEMDDKERKLLAQVEKYRQSLKNKTASQEKRYKNNVEFIKQMRAIEGYDDN